MNSGYSIIYRVEDDDGEKKLIDISDLIKNYNDL